MMMIMNCFIAVTVLGPLPVKGFAGILLGGGEGTSRTSTVVAGEKFYSVDVIIPCSDGIRGHLPGVATVL